MSYLIIGNGITGVTAAEVLRAADPACTLTIIADEPFPVYYRPALKDYLADRIHEDKLWARPSTFYQQQRVRFVPGQVVGIDTVRQAVQLHNGQQKRYDKLLLAHGASARQLSCPGLQLAGVSTLRTIDDYQKLRQGLASARRVVVCGSGTLALETAEALIHQGYAVTHMLRQRTLWSEILDTTASDLVLQEERRMGIDIHLEEEIAEIVGDKGRVSGVKTTHGTHIPCQIVIIAIGIEPHIEFARMSGIECGRGIKVDAAMHTNVPNIYAAGDVVEITNNETGATRVLGQWYPAIQQAHIAVASMLGQPVRQQASTDTFYNATFLGGLDFVSVGQTITTKQNAYQAYIAEPKPRMYRKLLLKNGVPIGALFLGNRKNALAFKRAIDHRVNLAAVSQHLFSDDFDLDAWLDKQNVPAVNVDSSKRASTEPGTKNSQAIYVPVAVYKGAQLISVPHPNVAVTFKEEQLRLGSEKISIGRRPEASLYIEHVSISRQHAEIEYVQGQYRVRDVGSSNGTFINNVKLPPNSIHLLQQSDKIRFGDVQFRFQQSELEQNKPKKGESGDTGKAVIVEGLKHRVDVQPLTRQRIQFEIDMCIGCDRCMNACPVPFSAQMRIATLNAATVEEEINEDIARFTQECILCGSCVPVCPVDNHRDLLMVSLKQRLGTSWENAIDEEKMSTVLPVGLTLAALSERLRAQKILSDRTLVPDNYLHHLIAASQLKSIAAGTVILREGEYGRDLYMILEGQLAISATDVKDQEFPIAIVGVGDLVGEYGMLTGQTYTTTVRTQTAAWVMQIPEQVMQRLIELVPGISDFFEKSNVDHSLKSILKRTPLFLGIADDALEYLIAQTQVKSYERNTHLFAQEGEGRPAREALHILLEGFVKVARLKRVEGGQQRQERVVAYRQGGDYFAGGLDLLGDSQAVSATTINRTRVAEIPDYAMQTLFQHYPDVKERFRLRLREYMESHNSMQTGRLPVISPKMIEASKQAEGTRRDRLHVLVNEGVVEGTEVLVIDLDACIQCNECEEACERRHGHSRMNRKGKVVGNINVVSACRQCQDPVCMLCSRAGIARLPNGEVYITESCIGCGICAERCPYHAISIIDTGEEEGSSSWQRFSNLFRHGIIKERKRTALPMLTKQKGKAGDKGQVAPGPLDVMQPYSGYDEIRKKLAIKCDLCAGYNDQACVQACPTGAAFRVHPTTFFGSTEEILQL
jgi:NADPH-dependent 2,4-dienoyl-CoA reductase/sulfur reductase-like enzyme/Fe-S-cluster-containing hydrogenase component 2/CRP-like cAMP-binding protein